MSDNWQLKAVISANAESMLKTLKSVNIASRATRKYLLDVANSAKNLAGHLGLPIGLLATVGSGFTAAGLKHIVTEFAELGDQSVKTAKRIGMSTQEFQRIKYMAQQSDVSIEGLSSSMGRLNKNAGLAAVGKGKDLASLFKHAGINLRDANHQVRSAADLLPEIAELFKRNQNAAVQARMGTTIFGKGWQELAPLLNDGAEGINELTERYKMLGLEIDEDALKAGERFGDQMDDLNQVTKSYGHTIAAKLLPVLSPMIENLIKWAVANRDLISTKVSAFVTELATDLEKVDWKGVVDGCSAFVKDLKDLVQMVGGARNALILLAVAINAETIVAMFGLAASTGRAGLALSGLALKALAPIAPLQVLTAGLTGAELKAATLTSTFGRLGAAIGLAGAAYAGWEVGSWANDHVINPMVNWFRGTKGDTLGTGLYNMLNPDEGKSLIAPTPVRASGAIEVNFKNAPAGMQVQSVSNGGNVPLKTAVGYRGYSQD